MKKKLLPQRHGDTENTKAKPGICFGEIVLVFLGVSVSPW
jgi:hypothetical protein